MARSLSRATQEAQSMHEVLPGGGGGGVSTYVQPKDQLKL